MNNLDYKVISLSTFSFIFQFLEVENTLKLLALILTICYTIRRWYLLEKNKKE